MGKPAVAMTKAESQGQFLCPDCIQATDKSWRPVVFNKQHASYFGYNHFDKLLIPTAEHIIRKNYWRLGRWLRFHNSSSEMASLPCEIPRICEDKLGIAWINAKKKFGLIATAQIPVGSYLPYLGVLRDAPVEQVQDYCRNFVGCDSSADVSYFQDDSALVMINAKKFGNYARFINHEKTHPNTKVEFLPFSSQLTQKYDMKGIYKDAAHRDMMPSCIPCYVTTAVIASGAELTVDYGPRYRYSW